MHAADNNSTSRIETMQNLEEGLSTVQKALMYNDGGMMQKGINLINENAKNIDAFDIKNEKGSEFKAKKYAKTEAKALPRLANEVKKAYYKGDKNRTLDAYRRLQNQCITCHKIVRKW